MINNSALYYTVNDDSTTFEIYSQNTTEPNVINCSQIIQNYYTTLFPNTL